MTEVSEIYPSLFSNDQVRIFVENTSVIKAVVLTFVTKLIIFYLSSIPYLSSLFQCKRKTNTKDAAYLSVQQK